MTPPSPQDPDSPPSVLQAITQRTGLAPKVLLSDTGSEHGASPVIAPGATSLRAPKGRGNYQMLGEIARGGMGVILKGHDTDLGRDVAMKVLDPELAKNPAVVQRFVEEAQIGGQLQHPGIVPVYELGLMADESPYFTMKLVKGRTLSALFQQRKSTSDDRGRLLAIFESVCQTVAYAHSKGVLHRDLKPANIMVGAFGEVQVVDWGLAKVLSRGGVADEKRAQDSLFTVIETVRSGPGSSGSDSLAGSVMGTPAYMAPEQAQGEIEKLDERADVFSLGAILCELLTGKPPYETIEGEPIVAQAAKAKLDPARARIEACGADPALVKLCLDCLMPSKAARPANADAVARAVHEYLTTVEERAKKAEVDAAEARIRAAEERRARRLTVALAGSVALAIALGSGGLWWANRERSARTAQMHAAVETAQGESLKLGQAGNHGEAFAAARRALALAEAGGADAGTLERAREFVATSQAAEEAAQREQDFVLKDNELREALVQLRIDQIGTVGNRQAEVELDQRFTSAFQEYGVDLEGSDIVPALERIRERDIAREVALALDDWSRVRRRIHGPRSEKTENLYVLAMDLDPDPERMRMRAAISEGDLPTLLELGAPDKLYRLDPGSIFVLSAALWDGWPQHRPDVYRMYDQAVHLYPGDYVLQSIGGTIYQDAGRFEASMACRTAALSLRPDNPIARMRDAESRFFNSRMTEAEGGYRALLGQHPEMGEAWYILGLCRLQLGDYADAMACVERALAIREDVGWRTDLIGLQYIQGHIGREQLETAIRAEVDPLRLITLLYPLVDGSPPSRRDSAYFLEVLEERAATFEGLDWVYLPKAAALARVGAWDAAEAELRGRYNQPEALVITPLATDFLRGLVYAKLGRTDAARECHARGVVRMATIVGGNPAAWERSDVMRWRRECETALGL
ncbi:MAG: protein kinase [Planctomycetota bacterium]|nr:protein kinase [Planctomycetota bacterium]